MNWYKKSITLKPLYQYEPEPPKVEPEKENSYSRIVEIALAAPSSGGVAFDTVQYIIDYLADEFFQIMDTSGARIKVFKKRGDTGFHKGSYFNEYNLEIEASDYILTNFKQDFSNRNLYNSGELLVSNISEHKIELIFGMVQ